MKLACVTFTQSGKQIAERVKNAFEQQSLSSLLQRSLAFLRRRQLTSNAVDIFSTDTYKEHLRAIFQEYDGVVFISATGIAVRLSAPFLQDKTLDPAIVVVDDLGRYAISLVSGHLGGANDLAHVLAHILDCEPIITTASDGRGIEAIDLFARRHGFLIENMRHAARITTLMVEGAPVRLFSEVPASIHYHNLVHEDPDACIYVTSRNGVGCDLPHCLVRPRILNVGVGCMRGKTKEEILRAITQVFQKHNLSMNSIQTIATIELKRNEPGILETCDALGCELKIYTTDQIKQIQHRFSQSQFVQSQIGIPAVCEPCAYLAGGEVIVNKTALDGVTVSVAREGKEIED